MGPPHDDGESDTKPSVSAEIARFLISGISQEETKFHHVVAILEEDVLSYVSDLVRCKPNDNLYTQLKNRLITQLADSESVRLRNLLSDTQLGDKKPSQLLHEIQDLSLGKIEESVVRMLWFQRLPITTQQILSVSTDKLASLVLTADKIAEISGARICVNSVEVESARLNRLEAQISELTSAVQQFQFNYKRFRNASPHRMYRTRFSSRNRSFCWYHSKFGNKAQKCVPPCDFSDNKDLEQVFQMLNEKGLVLNIEKCIFGTDKLPFLGCEVSKDGISPSKEKVEALVDYPQPQDQTGDKTSPRQQRHLEFISQFGTNIRYISGIQNTVADALSRIEEIGIPSEIDYEEIARAQTDDEELLTLQGANSNLVFKTISLEPHGTPLHCDVSTGNIHPYVPKAFRTTIINVIHSLAYSGANATANAVKQRFI
ncbi:hypothetical protein AVEN_4080-1 [Araneus ventricosus]|uniref:DUF7041 domain-containing protein n=1 Tax=Araneus ventricosus TaxID=182803 RepID=A0A4Y2IVR4_ARAVE|nr:hypothetical protein AVEN_4080-1 [Araneus ventricosus]